MTTSERAANPTMLGECRNLTNVCSGTEKTKLRSSLKDPAARDFVDYTTAERRLAARQCAHRQH